MIVENSWLLTEQTPPEDVSWCLTPTHGRRSAAGPGVWWWIQSTCRKIKIRTFTTGSRKENSKDSVTLLNLPAVFGMAATEWDVLQLEEMETLVSLIDTQRHTHIFIFKTPFFTLLCTIISFFVVFLVPSLIAPCSLADGIKRNDSSDVPDEQSGTGPERSSSHPSRWPLAHRPTADDRLTACYTLPVRTHSQAISKKTHRSAAASHSTQE